MNYLICFFSLFSSFVTCADASEQTLKDYLTIQYHNSIKAYELKLEKCQETEVVITPDDVKHISDDWKVLSVVLSYHYAKVQDLCAHDELERFTVLSAKLQALENSDKLILGKYNQLIMAIPLAYERTKSDYFVLPEGVREQFSNLEKLNRPFNLMKTMEGFDL